MTTELQLALPLPTFTSPPPPPPHPFDLNSDSVKLLDAPPKRTFLDAFEDLTNGVVFRPPSPPRTLALLHWNNQPNDHDDDDPTHSDVTSAFFFNREDGIAGWPPMKFQRKRVCRRRSVVDNGCVDCYGSRISTSMFVKVEMEGVAIARKIDLTNYTCFQSLKQSLFAMFGMFILTTEENSDNYKLTYKDREGDWLHADDDLSWRRFIGSVQRLKLMRNSGD